MSAAIKVRRVDFAAGDWLGGTATLSLAERGLYITACAMIYEAGGLIRKTDLRRMAGGRPETFNSLLLRLVDKGKLQLRDGMIDQIRCEREIAKAKRRISENPRIGNGSDRKRPDPSPHVLNENNDVQDPLRAGESYQGVAKEEGFDSKILQGDFGRCAPSEEAGQAPVDMDHQQDRDASVDSAVVVKAPPPTEEEKAAVDAAAERATAALRGEARKGIRDAPVYAAAISENKFKNLVTAVNKWVGTGLDGAARWQAWEILTIAHEAGAGSAMSSDSRKEFDKIVEMYRASGAEMAEAAA